MKKALKFGLIYYVALIYNNECQPVECEEQNLYKMKLT